MNTEKSFKNAYIAEAIDALKNFLKVHNCLKIHLLWYNIKIHILALTNRQFTDVNRAHVIIYSFAYVRT